MTTAAPVRPKKNTMTEEDVGNIMLLEHVNVQCPDQQIATLFYLVGMGFTRDPHMMVGLENMWVNLGEQQFHLPTNPAQVLRGHVGIVVPDPRALLERLEAVKPRLQGTKFAFEDLPDYIRVISPWGNELRCYGPGEFGSLNLGIPYVQFDVPRGTAAGIAAFYEKALGANASVRKDADGSAAVVQVGLYQQIVYKETDNADPNYDGHHIAIYIADFSSVYKFLSERGLVTEEPANHQLRFKEIVNPKTNEPLFTIEHEVRSLRHPQYRRPLVNRNVGQFLEPRRVGNQTVMGTVM
jgi:hypothetical protein